MIDFVNALIDSYNIPLLTAFLLGVLTSISPCPLATNITAIAYISREIKTVKNTLLNGFYYTLGRGISYTLLATLIYFGLSSFKISNIFQGWGDKILGPILIIIGLIMFGIIKINIGSHNEKIEKLKEWLATKGYIGSLFLGVLFALAFCPYSGVIYFGMLIPITVTSVQGLYLPLVFAVATGIPVIIFAYLIAFTVSGVGQLYDNLKIFEKWFRRIISILVIAVGIYYIIKIYI